MNTLNNDCILSIISFLDIIDINNVALVNKQFYIMSKHELIWKTFYDNDFNGVICLKQFYSDYKKCYSLNKFLLINKKRNINIVYTQKILDLHNKLYSIPPEIGQLAMLHLLDLSNNYLVSIPSEIGQLVMLHSLDLSNYQLQSVPPEIGNLVMLDTLSLDSNQLQSIPPEIGKLIMLETLYLCDNPLQSIPLENGQICTLCMFCVDDTQFNIIPENINKGIVRVF